MRKLYLLFLALSFALLVTPHHTFGWGGTGHKFINKRSVVHLPSSMSKMIGQASFLESHASDPDIRRDNSDTSFYAEWPRHFMDIDDYPNFHSLPRHLDSVIMLYGWERVKDNGINPWATVWVLDSLTKQLQRGDMSTAFLTAADLGHYVGDAHQPLHNAKNYNGQLSGNNGIHSRYESTMINDYQAFLTVVPESVEYVEHPIDFVFDYIYHTNSLVDSVLHADDSAKAIAGGTSGTVYYQELWNRTQGFTLDQMQSATYDLACLYYTAWVNAGLISLGVNEPQSSGIRFSFSQNAPNPFNPATTLSFTLEKPSRVSLVIYNVLGQEISTILNNEELSSGEHTLQFNASSYPSSVYFARLQTEYATAFRKLVLVK